MGSVGDFIMGGGQQKSSSNNSSGSTSDSSSANQSGQASVSTSNNASQNAAGSQNLSYGPIAAAMTPTLGYTAAGGNMMASLLGLPGYTPTSAPAAAKPVAVPNVLPKPTAAHAPTTPDLGSLLTLLKTATTPPPAPTPTPTPTPTTPTPTPTPTYNPIPYHPTVGGLDTTYLQARAKGGPVTAGQPYVVGEHQPELFVPNQSGTIVPQVPGQGQGMGIMHPNHSGPGGGTQPGVPIPSGVPTGLPHPVTGVPPVTPAVPPVSATNALTNWSNSGGMDFLRQQGINAITGAGAAGGTLMSGATGQALDRFGQGLGSTYLNQYMDQLGNFAKLGLGGASAMSGAGGIQSSTGSSTGGSTSASLGNSSGSSTGTSNSTSTGTSTGTGHTKNGLIPDLAAFVPKGPMPGAP